MKITESIILIVGVILIIIRGVYKDFLIDWVTLIIYVILASPMLFNYLKRLRLPGGTEFIFKERVKNLKQEFKEVKEKIKPNKKIEELINKSKSHYETFDFSFAKKYLEEQPTLALASMRIELEKKLRLAYEKLFSQKHNVSLMNIILKLEKENIINVYQSSLLLHILGVSDASIHRIAIEVSDARDVLNIAENLNKSFSIGYCLNFNINKGHEKYGFLCPWEHCIEFMRLPDRQTKKSCPIFGHECPGGKKQVENCIKIKNKLWANIRKIKELSEK